MSLALQTSRFVKGVGEGFKGFEGPQTRSNQPEIYLNPVFHA